MEVEIFMIEIYYLGIEKFITEIPVFVTLKLLDKSRDILLKDINI